MANQTEIDRFLERLEQIGIKQADLARALGETDQTITNWVSRGRIPGRRIAEVAAILECTVEWLQLGKIPTLEELEILPPQEAKVISLFRHINNGQRHAIVHLLEEIQPGSTANGEPELAKPSSTFKTEPGTPRASNRHNQQD